MRTVIYKVSFEENPMLDGEFDFKEEAIEWAEDHIDKKPVVKALDIEFPDEFGEDPIVYEEEEIFHYSEADLADAINSRFDAKFDEDELKAKLAELENEIDAVPEGAKLHRDFPQFESVEVKEDINSDIDQVAANWDEVHEELKEEAEPIEEDIILFDPFGCDFSECEPMEVCKDEHRADCCRDICVSPADFLKELAAELGIADEVEISEKECADGSCEEKHEDEIPCETCKDEISEVSDEIQVEEPVAVEDEVKVEVAPEAEVAAEEDIVPEEVKANEEPNVEVQVADEKPAEEISKCHVCPECGKEICECRNKELVEKNKVTYTTGDPAISDAHFNGAFEGGEGVSENLEEAKDLATIPGEAAYVLSKHRPEIEEMCDVSSKNTAEEIKDFIIKIINLEAKDTQAKRRIVSEFERSNENKASLLQHVFNVILGANNLYADPNKKWLRSSLEEDVQAEVDLEAARGNAKQLAVDSGKPVIYGYMGPDHHGKNRYFEIEPIECDNLKKCTQDVMNKYHPSGSVLVAYPDGAFMGEDLAEDIEMTDEDFAKAFKKGLEEKHNCK